MKRYWTFGAVVVLMAQAGFGDPEDSVRTLLERAAAATGTNYVTARNQLVMAGSNAVPELAAISSNAAEPWQIRLVAGVVAERIMRRDDITALINYDWRKDPDYDVNWEVNREGPMLHLAPLVTKRCRARGLWWHYAELAWKETGEHAPKPRMRETSWRGAYTSACRWSPGIRPSGPAAWRPPS